MSKKSTRATTSTKPRPDSDAKGRLVEQIAAQMHQSLGVKLETRARVSTIGNNTRTREIDVLLTSAVAGYPVRVAIECKNEKSPIGSPMIDAFIGKLEDIGIPRQQGVYISASGYTSGAIERATQAGIRSLILQGLTDDALSSAIADAFQSFVYLLPQVLQFTFPEGIPQTPNYVELLGFRNQEGQVVGIIPHIIWQHWRAGNLPSMLGELDLTLTIPDGWYQIINGERFTTPVVKARILIMGIIVTVKGQATQHTLVNATNRTVEKSHISANFDTQASSYPVTTIMTEEELAAFFQRPAALSVQIGRIPVPRIVFNLSFWPPSVRVAKMAMERAHVFKTEGILNPPALSIEDVEGGDISALWEPIWDGDLETLNMTPPTERTPETPGK